MPRRRRHRPQKNDGSGTVIYRRFQRLQIEAAVPGLPDNEIRGYHKPIMIAGGVGNVRAGHATKIDVPVGAKVAIIGGPAMLRSAAKNFRYVTVIVDPNDYHLVIQEMQASNGQTSLETRFALAKKVFQLTHQYDGAISAYLSKTQL